MSFAIVMSRELLPNKPQSPQLHGFSDLFLTFHHVSEHDLVFVHKNHHRSFVAQYFTQHRSSTCQGITSGGWGTNHHMPVEIIISFSQLGATYFLNLVMLQFWCWCQAIASSRPPSSISSIWKHWRSGVSGCTRANFTKCCWWWWWMGTGLRFWKSYPWHSVLGWFWVSPTPAKFLWQTECYQSTGLPIL